MSKSYKLFCWKYLVENANTNEFEFSYQIPMKYNRLTVIYFDGLYSI